jgi:Transcriptional regulator, AbiEi antitoxin
MAELAAEQYGVMSHRQLERLGYSSASIDRAIRAGRLHRLDRGAYAVGHRAVPRHGRCLAAVLAAGRSAVLSHGSAGWLWGLLSSFPSPPHVTAPRRGHQKGTARIHHSTAFEARDLTAHEAIPVTAVPRTLLDLATNARSRSLGNAVERAERLALLDIDAIDDLLGRCGRHPGRRKLQDALEIYRDPAFSRARSERLFIALVKAAGLPRPSINAFVAGHEIDAYWERERFAVEVDGWEWHRTRAAFESDPLRQEDLKLAGIDSIRITARRIEHEPNAVGRRLARLLDLRRRSLGPTGPLRS